MSEARAPSSIPGNAGASGGLAAEASPADSLASKLRGWRDGAGPEGAIAAMRSSAHTLHRAKWQTIAHLDLATTTPVYGGGTRAGEPDLQLPFRPRAIRNGIRNWWWWLNRFDERGQLRNSADLYKSMTALWGGPDDGSGTPEARPSSVRVTVEYDVDDVARRVFTYLPYVSKPNSQRLEVVRQDFRDPWLYALFPAKGELLSNDVAWTDLVRAARSINLPDIKGALRLDRAKASGKAFKPDAMPHDLLAPGLKLTLKVEAAKDLAGEAILQAVMAWAHFGGIGARTARGLGQLQIRGGWLGHERDGLSSVRALLKEVEAALGFDKRSWIGPPMASPLKAWEYGLGLYRDFRQLRDPPPPRNPGDPPSSPGRSYWPKADVVRAVSGRDMAGRHKVRHSAVPTFGGLDADEDSFWPLPELFFGAPIGVKFVGRQVTKGEPYAVEIVPCTDTGKPFTRYSSPVRILPWAQGGSWHPRVVVLPHDADLGSVGALVGNSPSRAEGQGQNEMKLLPHEAAGSSVFIEPGAWWPSKDENFDDAARDIWSRTPCTPGPRGEVRAEVRFLRDLGASDPIEALLAYLRWTSRR